jgi:hypothetical protein
MAVSISKGYHKIAAVSQIINIAEITIPPAKDPTTRCGH